MRNIKDGAKQQNSRSIYGDAEFLTLVAVVFNIERVKDRIVALILKVMTFQCVCHDLCSIPIGFCLFCSHFYKHTPVAAVLHLCWPFVMKEVVLKLVSVLPHNLHIFYFYEAQLCIG